MSDKQPDPIETFRNLITEWERGFDAMANRIMGTEEFSKSMNQLQDLQLGMQKRFNEAMAHQLTTLNLPSRDDMLRLGESIRSLDKRLAHIEDVLSSRSEKKGQKKGKKKGKKNKHREEDSSSDRTAREGPPRTKRPPSEQSGAADG